jgi:hypothetical protein
VSRLAPSPCSGYRLDSRWRATLARHLLVEALILLAFARLWALSGDLVQHPERQLVLLGVAAVGMGWQGALVAACDIPKVVSVALTGTELLLGIRLAQRIGRHAADRTGRTSAPILLTLMLTYTLAAFIVALAQPWIGVAFVPCLLVVGAVVLVWPKERWRGRS